MSEVLKNINKQSFTTKEAANYIGVSEYSLRASRMKDHLLLSAPPPKHINIGRSVRYMKNNLDNWLLSFQTEENQL